MADIEEGGPLTQEEILQHPLRILRLAVASHASFGKNEEVKEATFKLFHELEDELVELNYRPSGATEKWRDTLMETLDVSEEEAEIQEDERIVLDDEEEEEDEDN